MKKKTSRRGIDVDVDELDRIIDAAMREPLNENDGRRWCSMTKKQYSRRKLSVGTVKKSKAATTSR
jgi:hypothetical protein